ncbi:hypothetical protein H0H81_008198 [Sphagnurus paluster]|uniref:Nephrocystin 3-like N-terminal domain-containing protein n=1 Tax=Sphagnurus paluster TaxID=117069 RepID=A0A9P7FVP9_9AGAR|nr:hypothetical protein H0H81_008198 [Sphagnurus paluster]
MDLYVSAFVDKRIRRRENRIRPPVVSSVEHPWANWKLDQKFLKDLSEWSSNNPDTRLNKVFETVCAGLESGKDLIATIPNSPFPAQSLVTGLAYLFKLGMTISRAQKEVAKFAKDIISWFMQLQGAFESARGGRFTHSAWRDLEHLTYSSQRDLVVEICTWAATRLEDGRWTNPGRALKVQQEVNDFKDRISDAQKMFQSLSMINLARGIDSIKRDIRALWTEGQDRIIDEINLIRETQAKQLDEIIDKLDEAKETEERERFLKQALGPRTIIDPTYDKQEKSPCDDDTRIEVLAEIRDWVNDRTPESLNFLWLSGDPGCGKSAITASLAKDCKDRATLWAQFFINRNNALTTDPNSYFPSIARQLANRSTKVAQKIHDTLKLQQSLVDTVSSDQAAKLFIGSIIVASELAPGRPVVVIIDGLDETERKHLRNTATIFAELFSALSEYKNVKVFISSRTEDEIRNPFARALRDHRVKHIHLYTAESVADVSRYIKRRLEKIARDHSLDGETPPWPGEKRTTLLGQRASGLFIWAVTAIKFIEEEIDRNGFERLDGIFDMLTAENLQDINKLYALIITHTIPKDVPWEFERFRRVVGAIVHLQEPIPIDDLARLLDLRETPTSPPVDMHNFVRRLRTVLVSGTDIIEGKTIPRLHKSFAEFIVSTQIDERFRVIPEHAHLELVIRCLHQLRIARGLFNKTRIPLSIRYACQFWFKHLELSEQKAGGVVLVQYTPAPELQLAKFASLLSHTTKVIPFRLGFSSEESAIRATLNSEVRDWSVQDGVEIPKSKKALTGLTFSADGKKIATCSSDGSIQLWDADSDESGLTVAENASPLLSIAFSPDGKSIATGSKESTLSLWEIEADSPTTPREFLGHTGPVSCVAFAADGEQIASGSADGTCRIWTTSTGSNVNVINIAIPLVKVWFTQSPSLSCITFDGQIFLWDTHMVKPLRVGDAIGMSISPNKVTSSVVDYENRQQTIFSTGTTHGDVLLETSTRRRIIPSPLQRNAILAIALGSTGGHIFYASKTAIGVGNVETLKDIYGAVKFTGPPTVVGAFSPDMRHFASGDQNGLVHVYELMNRSDAGKRTYFSDIEKHLEVVELIEKVDAPRTSNSWILDGEIDKNFDRSFFNVDEGGWTYDGKVHNGGLKGTRWYKSKDQDSGEDSTVLWALVGDTIIKASRQGPDSRFEFWFKPA